MFVYNKKRYDIIPSDVKRKIMPSSLLVSGVDLERRKMAYLAVDLGGSHVTCGVLADGVLIASDSLSLNDSQSLITALPVISNTLLRLRETAGDRIDGVGLGFCGLVHEAKNRIISTNGKFVDAPDVDLHGWAETTVHAPLRIANDARLALRGEMSAGAGRGNLDVVMFTLGTGIGGVVALDGRLPAGAHGLAGCMGGHVPVTLGGRRCTCGGQGCAESEASGWALPMLCREQPDFATSRLSDTELNFLNLFALAEEGDVAAMRVRDHCLQVWGTVAVAAILAYDPAVVIFGGGVMKAADVILPSVRKHVRHNIWTPLSEPSIVATALGDHAALYGVESLFQEAR
jgi:glucokinase